MRVFQAQSKVYIYYVYMSLLYKLLNSMEMQKMRLCFVKR